MYKIKTLKKVGTTLSKETRGGVEATIREVRRRYVSAECLIIHRWVSSSSVTGSTSTPTARRLKRSAELSAGRAQNDAVAGRFFYFLLRQIGTQIYANGVGRNFPL